MTAKTYALNVTLSDTGKLSNKGNHAKYAYDDETSGLHVIAWVPIAKAAVPAAVRNLARAGRKTILEGTPATQPANAQPAIDVNAIIDAKLSAFMAALEKKLA